MFPLSRGCCVAVLGMCLWELVVFSDGARGNPVEDYDYYLQEILSREGLYHPEGRGNPEAPVESEPSARVKNVKEKSAGAPGMDWLTLRHFVSFFFCKSAFAVPCIYKQLLYVHFLLVSWHYFINTCIGVICMFSMSIFSNYIDVLGNIPCALKKVSFGNLVRV